MLRSKSFRRAASFYSIFLLSNQPSYLPSFSLFLFSIFVTIEYQNPKSSIISRYQKEVSFETTLLSPPLLFLPNFSNDNEMVWNNEHERQRERRDGKGGERKRERGSKQRQHVIHAWYLAILFPFSSPSFLVLKKL